MKLWVNYGNAIITNTSYETNNRINVFRNISLTTRQIGKRINFMNNKISENSLPLHLNSLAKMNCLVEFSKYIGSEIRLPASKSISNRALILNALSGNKSPVNNLSDCDDTNVMLAAFSSGTNNVNIGAAGTSMRFLTAYLAQKDGTWTITGSERMKNRPIRILVDALKQLGADIEYMEKEGFPPLKINGKKLQGGKISLDGSVSSQYISALMMIAPAMSEGLTLNLTGNVISQPYIRMTSRMMHDFGVEVEWRQQTISIKPQNYVPCAYTVESDWSAASYWYEILSFCPQGSEIKLLGLFEDSLQGDAKGALLFRSLNVSTEFTDNGVRIINKGLDACADGVCAGRDESGTEFKYDFVNEPDLAQTFVVTCVLKNIPFRFTGLQSLRIKETDRMSALQKEMKKLGYVIHDYKDCELVWSGERCEPEANPSIDTYEDHRMAMSFAPAAVIFGKININDPHVVSKSYPGFWDDLKSVGFVL